MMMFWMAYGSASGGLVRRLPFLKKCSIDRCEISVVNPLS